MNLNFISSTQKASAYNLYMLKIAYILIGFILTSSYLLADGFVQIMPKQKELLYKNLLPTVEDMEVQFLLKSENTMWYDAESIIPGYQDSMGDPVLVIIHK